MLRLIDAHRDDDLEVFHDLGADGPERFAKGFVLVTGEMHDHIVVAIDQPVAVWDLVIAAAGDVRRGFEVGLFGVRFDCLVHLWASHGVSGLGLIPAHIVPSRGGRATDAPLCFHVG